MKYKWTNNQAGISGIITLFLFTAVLLSGSTNVGKGASSLVLDRDPVPLRLYVVADAHVGNNDKGENMLAFANLANWNRPDVVLDLGDTFQAEISDHYNYDTHKEAAFQQHRDWLSAWNIIGIEYKAVALGNRDIRSETRTDRYTLSEDAWIASLGYEENPVRAGSRLLKSFIVKGEDVKALVFALCTYIDTFSMDEMTSWVQKEVAAFDGDYIIFGNHHVGVYEPLKKVLMENDVQTPAIFLHGHNHGPDTLVRDAWGLEQDDFDFPSYLVTDLMEKGIAAKFLFYPDGRYEKFRLDVNKSIISTPVMHHQTRVE